MQATSPALVVGIYQPPSYRIVKRGRVLTGEGYAAACPHCRNHHLFAMTVQPGTTTCRECGQAFAWMRPSVAATACPCSHTRRQHEPRAGACRVCECSVFQGN